VESPIITTPATASITFEDLDLNVNIKKAITACGYTSPTPVQAKAIPQAIAGKDLVVSAQTGSGKTAAFVIPILNYLASQEPSRSPRALILTPTRELATQITTAARLYGKFLNFNIVSLVGGMSYDPQIRDLQRGADIIVATPGRLIDHLENKRVDLSQVEILVLDEADRMVDMGFIEDVEIIAAKTPESRQTLFFSATIDKSIIKIVKRLLKDPVSIDLSQQQLSAPKIKQTLYKAKNMHHKSRMLKHFLNDENIFKAIIFSATKINADRLAAELRDDGFAAAPLHGDLRQNVRNRTIEALRRGKIQFLVATDVAARGLDISDISHVINYDLPKFSEDYVHRIGRTGRAGKTGEAISFFTAADMRNLQSIERYIGKRLTIQSDNFVYAETSTNSRSDADKYSPDAMLESNHGGGRNRGRDGGGSRRYNDGFKSSSDRPRRSFDRDEPRAAKPFGEKRSFNNTRPDSAEEPRSSFDRDEPRAAKPFGEKRSFNSDRADSSDRPRRSFDRDEPRAAKPFGEKRSFNSDRADSSDRPRRSFNRDEPRAAKPFGERRSFNNDRSESSDRPRRSFDRDEPRAAKPFGEKRSFNNDRTESSDRPRRSFDRAEPRTGKPFGEKRSFNSDRTESSDRPRRSFNRDEPRSGKPFGEKRSFNRDEPRAAKPFGEKRSFGDKPSSFDKPRTRTTRDDSRGAKPFGEKRSFNNDSRSFGDKPRRSPSRDESSAPRGRSEERSRSVFERPVYEFEKRDDNPRVMYKKRVDSDKPRTGEKSARPSFARSDASKKPRDGAKRSAPRSAVGGKNTKKSFREDK
jgi:superfamily II DNA/RNA helicase